MIVLNQNIWYFCAKMSIFCAKMSIFCSKKSIFTQKFNVKLFLPRSATCNFFYSEVHCSHFFTENNMQLFLPRSAMYNFVHEVQCAHFFSQRPTASPRGLCSLPQQPVASPGSLYRPGVSLEGLRHPPGNPL